MQRVSAQYRGSEPSEQKGGDLLNAAARAAKRLGLDDGGGAGRLGTIAPRNSMNRDVARDSVRETRRDAGREGGREVAGRDEEMARRGESPRGSSRGSSLNGGSSGSMRGGGHDDDYGFSPRRRALSNMSNVSQESEDATSHSAGVDEWRMSAPTSTADDGGATAASVSNRTHRTSSASSTGSVRSSSAYLPTSEGGTDSSSSTRRADAGRGGVRKQGEGRETTAGMAGTSERLSQQQLPPQSLDAGGGRGRGWGGGGGYDRRRDGYDRRKDDDEPPQVYFDDEGELRFLDATTSVDSREIAQDCIEFTQREKAGGAVRVYCLFNGLCVCVCNCLMCEMRACPSLMPCSETWLFSHPFNTEPP